MKGKSSKKLLMCGAFHGLEGITSKILIKFMSEIYKNDIKPSISIYIVPCVNPDGVAISTYGAKCAGVYQSFVEKVGSDKWQANARGVDINHNFDANWYVLHKLEVQNGITGPSNMRFGGEFPESELETKSIVKLCHKEKFDCAIAFHSQGEEIYWSFDGIIPKNSEIIAERMANLSGYTLSAPEGLAVGGGFKDWFIKFFNKPGFTVEVGRGTNPLPNSDLESIYEKLRPMLFDFVFNADKYI